MSDIGARILDNLLGRLQGPMQFRLFLQPGMALFFAIREGWNDARHGKPPYFFAVLTNPDHRADLLRQGWKAIARVFFLAILMDGIYQAIELHTFYPGEAVIVAVILAVIPYLLVRGPINRLIRPWLGKTAPLKS